VSYGDHDNDNGNDPDSDSDNEKALYIPEAHARHKVNKKPVLITIICSWLLLALSACTTVPITERQQLSLIPRDTVLQTSFQQYDQFMQEHELSDNQEWKQMVERVGHKIQQSVEQYFQQQGMAEQLEGYNWEFNLVESDQVNAFAMPGGKVVIFEGIMPIAENETGLAVVMAHEIAHAVAGHGNERMSQQLAAQFGGLALATALSERPAQTQQLWMAAFGIGTQVGILLPYSRLHESEADYLGLVFMAMAGYNPEEAVDFWQRMAAKKGGASPPEFLSTHPADQTRIEQIKDQLPEVMPIYRRNQ
jgi:predicted Zn-dependent protease